MIGDRLTAQSMRSLLFCRSASGLRAIQQLTDLIVQKANELNWLVRVSKCSNGHMIHIIRSCEVMISRIYDLFPTNEDVVYRIEHHLYTIASSV